jgi:predicted ribosomally synthesized peptide with SipW-like signal peptide
MADHRQVRRHGVRVIVTSVPLRLSLSLGMLLGFGGVGTMASWSDTVTVTGGGTFQSGRLDLQVGATVADQLAGQGGTWAHTTLKMSDMLPSEAVAVPLTIKNTGTTPLTYTGVFAVSTSSTLDPLLQLTVIEDSTVSNPVSNNLRQGACSTATGTTPWVSDVSLTSSTKTITPAAITLAPGAQTSLCVKVALLLTAPTGVQSLSTAVSLVFTANQPQP